MFGIPNHLIDAVEQHEIRPVDFDGEVESLSAGSTADISRNDDSEILIPVYVSADGTNPTAEVEWADGTTNSIATSATSFAAVVAEIGSISLGPDGTPLHAVRCTSDSDGTGSEVRAVRIRLDAEKTGTRTGL